jgi:ATP-binding cassette, subfamily B, bacterial
MALYFGAVFVLVVQNIPMQTVFIAMLSGAARDLERTLRTALVTRLQHLSIAFHDRTESGRLQAKVLRDVEQVQHFCMMVFESGALALLSILFAAGVTAVRQPRLLAFFVVMVPLVAGLRADLPPPHRRAQPRLPLEVERMSAEVAEMITMIPVVRAHGLEEEESRRMQTQFGAVNERGRRLDVINAVFGASAFTTFQLAMILALAVLALACRAGWISVGEIVLYQSLFAMIVMSVSQLLGIYPQLARGLESSAPSAKSSNARTSRSTRAASAVDSPRRRVAVRERRNSATPAPRPRPCKISRSPWPRANASRWSARAAPASPPSCNSSSASAARSRAASCFDGRNMEDLDMRTARRHVSVVPQETLLFSGSIRDNILFGLAGVDDARLREVIAAAQLTELVDSLPQGLDTRIGEDGALLSGGQRQRIAIARALVRNPRILVLDEATSALDVVSERKVQEAIDHAMRNRTTFIVAHRLSTIRKAHRIVVLRDGRAVQIGSYAELIARPGLFRDMQQLQTAAEK